MIKIRRKRLFEDDNTTQQNNQQQTVQQPVNNQLNQQTQQQVQQPTNTTQQQPNQQQQTVQQPQDPNNQQQQENPNKQKVTDMLNKMKNAYWVMSVNLPEEIQKEIPDFKQGNQLAEPAIKAWNELKQLTPDKVDDAQKKYNEFVDAFTQFGGLTQDNTNANNNQQTQQQQQQTTNNVNASFKAAYSFKKNLMENLAITKRNKYYNSLVKKYYNED